MGHAIGSTVWFRGDEVTITTEPYALYGGEFQDAVTEDGRTVTIATEKTRRETADERKAAEARAQDGFRRLKR